MHRVLLSLALANVALAGVAVSAADLVLVQNGKPRAEIVLAETPRRSARLAAHDLRHYVEKMSGGRLKIVTAPTRGVVHIYIGQSTATDRLGIKPDGLADGGYRMVTGDDWLVLLGDDTEFSPIEPWAHSNDEIISGVKQAEWDKLTGDHWGLPNLLLYKSQVALPGDTGLPDDRREAAGREPLVVWQQDGRGSFNAVAGLLGRLGVRWYMPGEIGEVVPNMPTIAVPRTDETVRPDFRFRRFNVRFGVHGTNLALWAMRLGLCDPLTGTLAHGMDDMTNHEAVFAAHPEWFAMYGGKRRFEPGKNNQLCYSNDELVEHTVRNVRMQFDHFKQEMVSVMPPDGYTTICQCPKCQGKDSPDRDWQGQLSNHVWGFVNRVAREVRKTHPDKKITNCAYGVYTLPPTDIDTLEPNVSVGIVGGRLPLRDGPEEQERIRKLREAWAAKTANPIVVFENYPFTDRGWYLPFFTPHKLGAGILATKGMSEGEDIWLTVRQDFEKTGMGLNHFLVYFTQAMYWGGKERDPDALLREYCRLFYGPAEVPMREFFEYCEAHWRDMENEKEKADRALELFAVAEAAASPDSVYGRRIAVIDEFLRGLRAKAVQLGRKRGPVGQLRLVEDADTPIAIDGRLDDAAWQKCPVASTGTLRELQTGRRPALGTDVKALWRGNDLYVAIRCQERPGDPPTIGSTRNEDSALWHGDVVEVLLETDAHSYYQIAFAPGGAIADLDRGVPPEEWFRWSSQAEVKAHLDDDHWTVEMRIPVTEDVNDPLHQVIGRKPTPSLPWHLNVCRQRVREHGMEASALSPTGTDSFHVPARFAHFYEGNVTEFAHGPPDEDFLEAAKTAGDLARTGRTAEALDAWKAAAGRGTSELQRSCALEQAAAQARALGNHDAAAELAAAIPAAAVKKTALMLNLLEKREAPRVMQRFGKEDFGSWPFWQVGEAAAARGTAAYAVKDGTAALRDLELAASWLVDDNQKGNTLLTLGAACRQLARDDGRAIAAYRRVYDTANEFKQCAAAVAVAEILRGQGKAAEARAELDRIDLEKMTAPAYRTMLLEARAKSR